MLTAPGLMPVTPPNLGIPRIRRVARKAAAVRTISRAQAEMACSIVSRQIDRRTISNPRRPTGADFLCVASSPTRYDREVREPTDALSTLLLAGDSGSRRVRAARFGRGGGGLHRRRARQRR